MDPFDQAFKELVGLEGNYSNDERDRANWSSGVVGQGKLGGTMYGISQANFPDVDIAALSLAKAKAIYLESYWDKLRCDTLPAPLAIALFKVGVNLGVSGAAKALQRSLKLKDDGQIGNLTIGVATSNPPKQVLEQFLTEVAWEYTQMKEFSTFGKGWLSRTIQTAVESNAQ